MSFNTEIDLCNYEPLSKKKILKDHPIFITNYFYIIFFILSINKRLNILPILQSRFYNSRK